MKSNHDNPNSGDQNFNSDKARADYYKILGIDTGHQEEAAGALKKIIGDIDGIPKNADELLKPKPARELPQDPELLATWYELAEVKIKLAHSLEDAQAAIKQYNNRFEDTNDRNSRMLIADKFDVSFNGDEYTVKRMRGDGMEGLLLVKNRQFNPGDTVAVERSNGTVEDDWTFVHMAAVETTDEQGKEIVEKRAVVMKKDSKGNNIQKKISLADLRMHNPAE